MIATANDMRLIRPIANNIEDYERIDPYIEEAEKLFIIPAIGAELYKKIDTDRSYYKELLKGGYYNDDKCRFEGLIYAICYLAYSRFVKNNMVNVTAFGLKYKNTQYSENVEERTLIRHANEAEKAGQEYLRQCIEYLRFINTGCCKHPIKMKRKFKSIGR